MTASRCCISMCLLLSYWILATWSSRAQTSIKAELPSGKLLTTWVRRRGSRFNDIVGVDTLKFGYLQSDILGSGGETAVAVSVAVARMLLIVFKPRSLCELLRFGFRQFISNGYCRNFILPEICKPWTFFICENYCTLSYEPISLGAYKENDTKSR